MAKRDSVRKKNQIENEEYFGKAGDDMQDAIDEIYHQEVKSGKIFNRSVEEYTHRMDMSSLIHFFDRIESYNMVDLIIDFGLDKTKIDAWYDGYKKFKTKITRSNNQLISQNTTVEQVILYYYLVRLKIIDIERMQALLPTDIARSGLIAFLLNKDHFNVRKKLREINSIENGRGSFNGKNLQKLAELADNIKCRELSDMIQADIKKNKS